MFVKLPEPVSIDGQPHDGLHILVQHNKEKVVTACGNVSNHQTKVVIKTEQVVLAEAEAKCSEKDQFTKREGRRLALSRALKRDNQYLISKNNRRAIWKLICPKLCQKG